MIIAQGHLRYVALRSHDSFRKVRSSGLRHWRVEKQCRHPNQPIGSVYDRHVRGTREHAELGSGKALEITCHPAADSRNICNACSGRMTSESPIMISVGALTD